MIGDILTGFTLLTRIPLNRFYPSGFEPLLGRAVWVFPVVGLVVGAANAAVYGLAIAFGMTPLLAAAWTLAANVMLTGALHEDGLADVADGFGGGNTSQRKMDIMRDSRIGTYGGLALLLALLIRAAAMAALGRPREVAIALIVSAVLGRGGMIVTSLALKPARADGLGASLQDIPRTSWIAGLTVTLLTAILCLPIDIAMPTLAAALFACLLVAAIAHRQIGGRTGDVLGAGELTVECVTISVIAALCGTGG